MMETKPVQCASCGKTAAGKFCSHCGAPLVSKCPACRADVKSGSRACHQCGASLAARAAPTKWNAQTIAPWAALGLATVALITAMWPRIERGRDAAPPTAVQFSESVPEAFSTPGQPPDLASMTPRQAADRLFNRVMIARENGNTEEALQFAPMAIQAYDRAGPLDNDARYHVALIHMTVGDMKSARDQLDKLRQSVPNHLLGFMLEREIADRSGNKQGVARAYKNFLAAYDKEIAAARVEYQEHKSGIERFREAARAGTAGKQ